MDLYRSLFGKKLRAARKSIPGMNQEALARKLGVEPPTVSRWETGDAFPDDDRLPLIYKALNVGPDYFLEGTGALPDFKSCGELLLALSQADTDFQRFVLTVIHKDVSHMRGSPKLEPLIPQVLALLKLL